MSLEQELKGRIQANARIARNILAEKGSMRWTPQEQKVFDHHMDDAERAQERLDAIMVAHGDAETILAQQREGLDIFLRKGATNVTAHEKRLITNTMSTTTGSQGGNTLAPLVANDLINSLRGWGWVRYVATEFTTESGADQGVPTSDGTSEVGELVAQNVLATSLDPSFGTVPVNCYRFSSKLFTVPFELLQDSAIDIEAFVQKRAIDRIGRAQNVKFSVGTGTGEPMGIVTASSVGKVGITGQTTTIIYDDLVDVADSIDAAYQVMPDKNPNAVHPTFGWMMSQTMRKVVRKVKDTAGRPIWMPSYDEGLTDSADKLLGYPVYLNSDMAAPAANAKSLIFGNLGMYLVRDALEVTLYRFDDSAFNKAGQVGFLAFARAGGNLADTSAVRYYQHSAT